MSLQMGPPQPVANATSHTSENVHRPIGNTTSIGCVGCLATLAGLAISPAPPRKLGLRPGSASEVPHHLVVGSAATEGRTHGANRLELPSTRLNDLWQDARVP